MAEPVDFKGSTHHFGPPPGEEERVGHLHVLMNGSQVVSAWRFTKEQLQELMDGDGTVYVLTWTGASVVPQFCGTKHEVNQLLLDFGKEVIG